MFKLKSSDYKVYSKFLGNLANKLTKYYFTKLNKPFKISNKLKGKGYDPVTNVDILFEKFITKKLKKNFITSNYRRKFGHTKSSDFSWVIDL